MWNWRRYSSLGKRQIRPFVGKPASQRLTVGELIALASTAIAFCSFVVASAAVYFALSAQRLDQEYRELSVRPQLKFYLDTGNFRLVVENVGPGHAEIAAVFIFDHEKCVRVDASTPNEIAWATIEEYEERLTRTLKKTIEEYYKRSKSSVSHVIQTRSLYVGDFLPPGKEFALFELQLGFKEELQKYNLWLAAKDELAANPLSGMSYRFCSASGRYCRYLVSEDMSKVCKALMSP
jgi:hypothetical protein